MKKQLLLFCLLALLGATTTNLAASPPPPIYYVKIGGSDAAAGNSWATAFATLQKALSVATSGDQIWVAKGTYYPTADASGNLSPADPRTKTFVMKNGVAIFGGFVGNEAANYDLSLRNFTSNETILSGDIDGTPDVVTGSGSTLSISGNGGNVFHVFSNASGLTNTAILDGFTVSGGNANGTDPHHRGGGMVNDGSGAGNFCSPTIRNCNFTHNNASSGGGGIYNRGSNGNSSPQMSNCTFLANIAGYGGGILHFATGTTSYTNCDFNNNKATIGGAIAFSTHANQTATHTFLNCNFTSNAADYAGAIQSGFSSETGTRTVSMTNCTFSDNRALSYGAFSNGLPSTTGSTPVFFTNCIFKNNLAHDGSTIGSGGAYQSQGGPSSQMATFTNCLLDGNKAMGTADDGGGAIMIYDGTVTLINSTVVNSQTATHGGVVSVYGNTGSVFIKNSILWNNTATSNNSIYNGGGGNADAQYSLLQDASCPANVTCGAGMLYNQDPLFVNLAGGDLRLQACSPAINVGNNAENSTTTDLDGNNRKVGVIDLGAYEYTSTAPPNSIIAGSVGVACVGGTIQLTASSGMNTYSWTRQANKFSSTLQNPVIPSAKLTDAGAYLVTAKGRFGRCTSGSAMVLVIVTNPSINPAFTVSPSNIAQGAAITLSATSATGTFSWSGPAGFSGSTRSKTINSFQPANNGVYRLTLTSGLCKGYSEKTLIISTATRLAASEEAEEIDMEINAYPNPVTNILTVEVTLQKPSKLSLKLFNSIGNERGTWQLNEESTYHKTELNMSELTGGVYLLQAQAGKQKVIERVVKVQY